MISLNTLLLIGTAFADPGLPDAPWAQQVEAESQQVQKLDPELARSLQDLQPMITRSRQARFQSELFLHPSAHWIISERILQSQDPIDVRAALVHAYITLPGAQPHLLLYLAQTDSEPQIRGAAVASLGRSPLKAGNEALRIGLADPAASVRLLGASNAGYRADGHLLSNDLIAALSDPDPMVRAHAARALGWLNVTSAWIHLAPLLVDVSADARVHALRAMRTLDRDATAQRPELASLLTDNDERVVVVARSLSAP